MVELDIAKYDIVPRLRNREWNGAPHCLWANIFQQDIPNTPIVAFGLDSPATVIFPERKVFTAAGYTPEIVMEKALEFLRKQKPIWEDFDPEISEEEKIDFPKVLSYYHEYGAEQILNKNFLAEACGKFNSPFVFVAAMNQKSILAMAYTQDANALFQFIALQLFRFGYGAETRIAPGVFMADKEGRLVGGVAYAQELYDNIMQTVEAENDSHVEVHLVQRQSQGQGQGQSQQALELIAYGSKPEQLFAEIWTTILVESNKLKLKVDSNQESLLEVVLILVVDKMPPLELFDKEIEYLNKRVSGSNEDIKDFGATGMFNLKILYKKSSSLLI